MSDRAKYWERLVVAWEKSGLSQAEFCRRRRLKAVTFSWWKGRLRGWEQRGGTRVNGLAARAHDSTRADFVEVALPKSPSVVGSASMPGFTAEPRNYEIALTSGRVIRLPHDFDPNIVARLVSAVESC